MKKIGLFLLIAFSIGCNILAQNVKWVPDVDGRTEIPVGLCTWLDLQSGSFFSDMEAFYNQYQPNPILLGDMVTQMRTFFPEYKLHANVFFGAWDYDSQQLVGEFERYQQYLRSEYQYSDFTYHLIAEDREMHSVEGVPAVSQLPVILVSLFPSDPSQPVVAVPIGTIEKTPTTSLEEDLYMMLIRYRKAHNR